MGFLGRCVACESTQFEKILTVETPINTSDSTSASFWNNGEYSRHQQEQQTFLVTYIIYDTIWYLYPSNKYGVY